MSEQAYDHAFNAAPDRQTRTFDFPALMDLLRGRLTVAQVDTAGETLREMIPAFEKFVRDSQPLPVRLRRLAEAGREDLARTSALHARLREHVVGPSGPATVSGPLPASLNDAPTVSSADRAPWQFDPTVEILITLNYWHLARTSGPDAADAALTGIVKRLKRKPMMGRPSRRLSQIREAKRLRDEEHLTHGQIARRLGFRDGKTVGLALKYHFRDQQVEKKSR